MQELTYEVSLGALNQQESALNELRSRTGVLLAATAIAIALLGGRALDDGGHTVLELAGTAFAQAVIDRLVAAFRWACLTLVGAVGLWSLALAVQ
jgi:hypothetical protein